MRPRWQERHSCKSCSMAWRCRQQGAAPCRHLPDHVGIVIVLSQIFYLLGTSVTYQVIDPETHKAEPPPPPSTAC